MSNGDDDSPRDVELSQNDPARLRVALHIATQNLIRITRERQEERKVLVAALETALILLDQLLTEMRIAGVTPSAGVVVTKAKFDAAMRKILNP
jgi:hypothetical protein